MTHSDVGVYIWSDESCLEFLEDKGKTLNWRQPLTQSKHKKQMCVAGHTAEEINYIRTEAPTCYWWVLKHCRYKMFYDSEIPELVPATFNLALVYISVWVGVTHR